MAAKRHPRDPKPLPKWRRRLQRVYSSFSEYMSFMRTYNLHKKLGYDCPLDAWTANPIVEGSVLPRDYRAVSRPEPKTTVLFRRWKAKPETIVAIFPELPGTYNPGTCSSYEHVGQHGSCDPDALIRFTTPVRRAEFKALFRELTRIGYKLQVVKRLRQEHYRTRREMLSFHYA